MGCLLVQVCGFVEGTLVGDDVLVGERLGMKYSWEVDR